MRRNAVLFVLVSALSGFGSTAMTLAAAVWIVELTGSVGLAALAGVCTYAPTFAAPWLGALVDRLPRRPLLIGADLMLGLLMLTLLGVRSAAGVWLVFVVLLARGVGYVVIDAGETAILPAVLSPPLLGEVNGWRSSAQEGMKLVAPAAGAGLYAWHGPTPVVLIGALTPLLTAACYSALRVRRAADGDPVASAGEQDPATARGPEGRGGWREGLRALSARPGVRTPVLLAGVAIGMSGLTNAAVLARIVHDLALPATHLGYLTTAQGAGSIAGGLAVGRLLARFAPTVVAVVGATVFAAGCVAWVLPWWPAMIVGSVLAGTGLPWALVAAVTAVQTRTPGRLLGRVSATANTVMFGPVALGIPLGSALVHWGGRPPLLAAAVVTVVAGVAALRSAGTATPALR